MDRGSGRGEEEAIEKWKSDRNMLAEQIRRRGGRDAGKLVGMVVG